MNLSQPNIGTSGLLLPCWIALALLFCPFQGVVAGDWTQFRGVTGDGHAKGLELPLKWKFESPADSSNIAWRRPLPGNGWSSPVLYENRIYLTTAVEGDGLSLRALCLDAVTGETVWNREVFAPGQDKKIHKKNSHASPTPLIAGNRLFVHFGHLGSACLDLQGNIVWKNTTLAYSPVHGNGGSPVLVGDALIFSCDGSSDPFVAALHRKTGKVLWKTGRDTEVNKHFSFSTPLVIEVKGRTQVISPGSGAVCAYDPVTGKELWRVRYGEGYSVVPRPIFGHGLVFVATGFDRPTVLAIRPDGQGDVTDSHVVWTVKRGAPLTPSLLLVGDELYMVSDGGIASCLDAKTGASHWQERIGGKHSSSPVYSQGRIYCQSEDGDGIVIRAGKEFEKLSTNPLNERTLASYAVDDKALYIRGEQHLFKIQSP